MIILSNLRIALSIRQLIERDLGNLFPTFLESMKTKFGRNANSIDAGATCEKKKNTRKLLILPDGKMSSCKASTGRTLIKEEIS